MDGARTEVGRTRFVTRHAGAQEWARRFGLDAEILAHLDPSDLEDGDVVMGTLPLHLVAEVCRRGGRYLHLVLELPPELRGISLSAEDMQRLGARLEEYRVERLGVVDMTGNGPGNGGGEENG